MSWHGIPLEGKTIRQLCGTVLIMEAVVIGLAIPVAIVLEHANRGLAGGIGGALAVCAVLLGGMIGRPGMGWALWAGTALQLLVIAVGVVVPAMYVLGAIFAALWLTGIWLARRHETLRAQASGQRAASARSGPAPPAPTSPGAPTSNVLGKSSCYAKNPLWSLAAHLHRLLVQAQRPARTNRFCITLLVSPGLSSRPARSVGGTPAVA